MAGVSCSLLAQTTAPCKLSVTCSAWRPLFSRSAIQPLTSLLNSWSCPWSPWAVLTSKGATAMLK